MIDFYFVLLEYPSSNLFLTIQLKITWLLHQLLFVVKSYTRSNS